MLEKYPKIVLHRVKKRILNKKTMINCAKNKNHRLNRQRYRIFYWYHVLRNRYKQEKLQLALHLKRFFFVCGQMNTDHQYGVLEHKKRKKNNFKRIDITYSWTIIPGCTIPCVPIFFSISILFEYREFYHKFIFTCH